jgi:hypothetical protein
MKVQWIPGKVTALMLLMALGGACACAQAEIDPDHFDSPNTEPFDQPKTQSQAHAKRYAGNFSLPYAGHCSGKQLAPGKDSVPLRSYGKVGHGVLKSESQFIEITSTVHSQGSKRGADVVVVGSKRKSSNAIRYPSREREFCVFEEFAKPRQPVSSPHRFRWAAGIGSLALVSSTVFLKFAHDPTGSC